MKNKLFKSTTLFCMLCFAACFMVSTGDVYGQDDAQKKAIENLEVAARNYKADPSEENTIWLGRRTAYLGKYKEAIGIYTGGLKKFPKSYKLYRHRGHRYISIRQFPNAIADFKLAIQLIKGKPLEIEPDGLPNAANIPLSNTHFNIYYHLGLAYYCLQDYKNAAAAYEECLKWCKNDDSRCATIHWAYMTYRLMKKKLEAELLLTPIHEKMKIIEDFDYFNLVLMYKGIQKPAELEKTGTSAASMYGQGNWYYYNGNLSKAREIFKKMLSAGKSAAFGYIAAECHPVLKKRQK